MRKINVVYQNGNMPADILEPIYAPNDSYEVVWSRKPQVGSDVVVYFNQFAFNEKLHKALCSDSICVLYMYEPVAIDPVQYTKRIWKKFDAILTWNTYLTGSSDAFIFDAAIYYDLPYCQHYGIGVSADSDEDLLKRERAICQICGDKYSLSLEEIYSLRRKMARWFHSDGKMRMDVFGRPAMDVPNYRGECVDKLATFSKYRYAICFENTFHEQWTRGYLTEKILDCMSAGVVPVYYGCSNIEELVPSDCFIDYRQFSSFSEMERFLLNLSDDEYLGYVKRMRAFLAEYNAPEKHSAFRFYETLAKLDKDSLKQSKQWPEDYWEKSTFIGKIRFLGMRYLLPYHRFVYPMFSVLRKLGSLKKRSI